MPKMFVTDDDRCPVAVFKEFVARRPPEIRGNDPFVSDMCQKPNVVRVVQENSNGGQQHDEVNR